MNYLRLMRLDKPIGSYLLLWSCWWALLLAGQGYVSLKIAFIFTAGVFITRSAGCIINDIFDKDLDLYVKRTKERPLASGSVKTLPSLLLFIFLLLCALLLVSFTNYLTIMLSIIAVLLMSIYPLCKRFTHLPQVVLGFAFSMSIPMAFAATTNALPHHLWLIYFVNVVWTLCYDTIYAMIDKSDDLKIGVKSSAILFGDYATIIIALLHAATAIGLYAMGVVFSLGIYYYVSLGLAIALLIYYQTLIQKRNRQSYFRAFRHHHYMGLIIVIGIALDYYL